MHPAGADRGRRGARSHRPLVPRAASAAAGVRPGSWLRQTRHGRTGHDAPLLLVAGTRGFGFRSGEVWGIHLGWSGDASWWAERLPDGSSVLGAAELGEVVLAPGEEYATPWLYAAWSDEGLDGLSARLHRFIRSRAEPPATAATGGPEHVGGGLLRPPARAADRARRHRRRARRRALRARRRLVPPPARRHRRAWRLVRRRGRLAAGPAPADRPRARPRDGVRPVGRAGDGQPRLRPRPRASGLGPPRAAVAQPAGARHHDPGGLRVHPRAARRAAERVRRSRTSSGTTTATWSRRRTTRRWPSYRLLDELRARHPEVEIESCSSGGARVDLGILARTDRVWASDTNDALERQRIQRWTQLLLPPELVGSHVGPPRAHTTGRTHDLSFRAATALFGHFGIEWDVSVGVGRGARRAGRVDRSLQAVARRCCTAARSCAPTSPTRPSPCTASSRPTAREALFCFVALATSASERPGAVRLPGLDPDRRYTVNG